MQDYKQIIKQEGDLERFESHGLPCLLVRIPGVGYWCGYVGVPPEHPLYGKGWDDFITPPPHLLERQRTEEQTGVIPLFLQAFSEKKDEDEWRIDVAFAVHGGITFAGKPGSADKEDRHWYFGFDCAHAGDLDPLSGYPSSGVYRDKGYVRQEAEGLAEQLSSF